MTGKAVVSVGTASAAMIAVAGLAGYAPGLRVLGSIRVGYIPMAPSTAGCFLLLSAILYVNARKPRRGAGRSAMIALALLVTAFGMLTVGGSLTGMDLTFELWFTRGFGTLGSIPIGRMSSLTAAAFVVAGMGTVQLLRQAGSPRHAERLGYWASSFGVLTVLFASTVLLAYVYGNPLLYGGTAVPMAARSPSPWYEMTIESGLVRLTAVATAGARPCAAWKLPQLK